jgi:hypothetical protein
MQRFTIYCLLVLGLVGIAPHARAAVDSSEDASSHAKLKDVEHELEDEKDDEDEDDVSAAEEGSEYFAMPEAKKVKAEFAVGVNQQSYQISGGGRYTALTSNIRMDLGYGFNEHVAVSGELGFSSGRQKFENESNTQGLEDVQLNLNMGNKIADRAAIRYGVETILSPDRYIEDNDESTNRFTGGRWAAPYVGMEFRRDFGVTGFKYSYEMPLGKREATFQGVDAEYNGGETVKFTVFYERNLAPKVLFATHLEYARSTRVDIYQGEAFPSVTPEYTLVFGLSIEQKKFTHTPEISILATTDSEVDGKYYAGAKFEGLELDYHLGF